jgi:hypothetical protein
VLASTEMYYRPHWPRPNIAGWIGVLHLASQWSFARARDDAIDALDQRVDAPEQRVLLARNYTISGWQAQALLDLACREEPMGVSDVDILGITTVLKLASLRERYGSIITGERAARASDRVSACTRHKGDLDAVSGAYRDAVRALNVKQVRFLANQSALSQLAAPTASTSRGTDNESAAKISNAVKLDEDLLEENATRHSSAIVALNAVPKLTLDVIRAEFGLGQHD